VALAWLASTSGCGRIGFDPTSDGGVEASSPLDTGLIDSGPVDTGPRGDGSAEGGPRPDSGADGGCALCDPFDSATCSGGEVCDVSPFFANTDPGLCRAVGLIERGEMCVPRGSAGDCVAGHVCFDDFGCVQVCRSNLDCGSRGVCLLIAAGGCVGLCSDLCSVLSQTGCPTGRGCQPLTLTGGGNLCRFANPAGMDGTRCFKPSDCAAGYVCVGDPSTMDMDDGLCVRLWPCSGVPCGGSPLMFGRDLDGTPICGCPV